MNKIRFEKLANGLWRAYDYGSKLTGLYNADGSHRSGDLRLRRDYVISRIAQG